MCLTNTMSVTYFFIDILMVCSFIIAFFTFLLFFFVVLEMSFLQLDLWKFIVFVLLSLIISVKEDQEILKILTWEKSA